MNARLTLFAAASVAALAALLSSTRCGGGGGIAEAAKPASPVPASSGGAIFTDVATEVGLDFTHFNGMTGEFYFCEMMGPGGALIDYDNDADLDVFVLQGTMLGPGKTLAEALFPPRGPLPPRARLYRNDLRTGSTSPESLHFTDVTEASGIDAAGYGMGVAAGDYDNDGWTDLYIANFGHNQMFKNNGNGTFTDVTRRAGTDDARWSTSAAFLDYDRDGWLDLFVCNYVDFNFANLKKCVARFSTAQDYCSPLDYKPVPDRLFHNRRDGTFEDVTGRSQIGREFRGALGVVSADFDADGWIDLYVANDGRPHHLWINRRDGTFENEGLMAGCALSGEGKAEAGMGADAGDFDADGDEDIFVTHLKGEANRLYVNDGKGTFEDQTIARGLPARQAWTGFGAGWIDYDNDGWLDLLVVNGAVTTIEQQVKAGDPFPLRQPKQLFHNRGDGRLEEVTDKAGAIFARNEVSRGAAFGDVDNDGDVDVLVVNNNGPIRLLRNDAGGRNHWLGLRMVGGPSGRDMLGTRVGLLRPGSPPLWRRARTDGSYCSASDPRVLFGLGNSAEIAAVRAIWPDGREEEWKGIQVDRWTTLRQGSGDGGR